jgi:hypothetical protein
VDPFSGAPATKPKRVKPHPPFVWWAGPHGDMLKALAAADSAPFVPPALGEEGSTHQRGLTLLCKFGFGMETVSVEG